MEHFVDMLQSLLNATVMPAKSDSDLRNTVFKIAK